MNVFENANNMARPKDADTDPLAAYGDAIVAKFDTQAHAAIEHGGTIFIVRKQQPARTTSDHVAQMNARNKAFWRQQ